MRATAVRESTRAPAGRSPGKVLAGTGTLIRFILRRDRIKLPAWLLGITVLLFYFATALSELAETEEGRRRQARAGIGHARSRRATVLAALETCLVVLPFGCRVLTGWWLRSSRHSRLLRALFRPASIVNTYSAGAHRLRPGHGSRQSGSQF